MLTERQFAELEAAGEVRHCLVFEAERNEKCGECRWMVNDAGDFQCPSCSQLISGNQPHILRETLRVGTREDWRDCLDQLLLVQKIYRKGDWVQLRQVYYSYVDENRTPKNDRLFYVLR